MEAYLMLLEVMDHDVRKDWERRLMSEVMDLRMIQDDFKALKMHMETKEDQIIIPEWIMDPQLRAEAE